MKKFSHKSLVIYGIIAVSLIFNVVLSIYMSKSLPNLKLMHNKNQAYTADKKIDQSSNKIIVFQTDFGDKDGAVSAMKGVALSVDSSLKLYDLTHEIPNYDIWEAAYRLEQTSKYWPKGTVIVSVVDPGVGTNRKSVVLKTKNGYYFVGPDNGTWTLIAESMGIDELREIDEKTNRIPNSQESYTFYGRDVFAYTAARLASGVIKYEEVGPLLKPEVVNLAYQKPICENGVVKGMIPILDIQYGNIWSNIDKNTFEKLSVKKGDMLNIEIKNKNDIVYKGKIKYVSTFGDVEKGESLVYLNEMLNVSLAINMGSFSNEYKVYSGVDWNISITK